MNRNYSINASSSSSSNRDADPNDNLYPAHAAALAENQAKEAEISQHIGLKGKTRAKRTTNSYKNKRQQFLEWCAKEYRYEVEPGVFEVDELVTEKKLLRFMQEVIQPEGSRKRKWDDGETMPPGYESHQQYIKAIIDLYQDQVASGRNKHPHPRGQELNVWRKERMIIAEIEALRQENLALKQSVEALHNKLDRVMSGHFRFISGGSNSGSMATANVESSIRSQAVQNSTRGSDEPPLYELDTTIQTVNEVWREWSVGLGNNLPAVSKLEEKWKAAWRSSPAMRQRFSRRMLVVKAVKAIAEQKQKSEDEAVELLENIRRSRPNMTLNQLIKDLKLANPTTLTTLNVTKTF